MHTETIDTTTAAEVPTSKARKTTKAPKASQRPAAGKKPPQAKKPAKKAKARKVAAKPVAKKAAKASSTKRDRPASKKPEVIAMIQAKGGATLEAIMKRTGWQKHTVRGFMATVPAKLGLKLKSENNGRSRFDHRGRT